MKQHSSDSLSGQFNNAVTREAVDPQVMWDRLLKQAVTTTHAVRQQRTEVGLGRFD